MDLCPAEVCYIVEHYFRTSSYDAVREKFRLKFGDTRALHNTTIKRIIDRFQKDHTLERRKGSGRPKTARTAANREEVRIAITQNPRLSVRKLSAAVSVSRPSTHRLLKELKLYPYRFSVRQELKIPDYHRRLVYCRWLRNFIRPGIAKFDNVFFSDEAWVHLDGYVNAQNYRLWASENPEAFVEKGLHPQKLGIWCAISRKRVVGPFFFSQTINAERYQAIITDFIASLEPEERDCWFQQDGATAHTAESTIAFLKEFFGERLITRPLWPPRSPDLTPPDFFLWGFIKDRVFTRGPDSVEKLKEFITDAIEEITPEMLKSVFRNLQRRISVCIAVQGGHIEHML